MKKIFLLITWLGMLTFCMAQSAPRALVVIAHPDDETGFAATIYKITKELHGTVDMCVVTNGEGGYKYSTLSEAYYGLELTDEKIGRENLPRIRKQELMNAGKIIGINNYFFLDQKDAHYSTDEHEPLDTSWNVPLIQTRLKEILNTHPYDFVFCLLPTGETHGGHKSATMLALRAVQALPEAKRPVILGGGISFEKDSAKHFSQLKNYAETSTVGDTALFHFDRNVKFGFKNVLNYQMVVNWEIAEHKSQGTMQLAMGQALREDFWLFGLNNSAAFAKAAAFFERLKRVPYVTKTY